MGFGAQKVLFIGADAMDKDLIQQWANEGELPTFNRLFEQSRWGITSNPVGFFVGAVWPSFYTAVSPARHARYCYYQLKSGSYENVKITPHDVKFEPFWNVLSENGRRVAVIDIPKAPPATNLNGIQVLDWGTHDQDFEFSAFPNSLRGEIEHRFGLHPVRWCDGYRKTLEEFKTLLDGLILGVKTKAQIVSSLLARDSWDCALAVFGESHCAGHQLWHLHDCDHSEFDATFVSSFGDPLKTVYRAIDQAIGKLLQEIGTKTTVFILASHGIGPHYDASFMLEKILGLLEFQPVSRTADSATPPLPDLSLRKYFAIPNNDVYGGIRINLVGREPNGQIQPGTDCDELCEALSEDLKSFVNLDSSEPLVRSVIRTKDLYRGEYLDELPDLLVEWNRDKPVSNIFSPKTGQIQDQFTGSRTGDHKPEGLVFAYGPCVRPGRFDNPVSVVDIAPTICSLLNIPLTNVDGKPIKGLFSA